MLYKIIESYASYQLQVDVQRSIALGWRPTGGVVVIPNGFAERKWVQAMILEECKE